MVSTVSKLTSPALYDQNTIAPLNDTERTRVRPGILEGFTGIPRAKKLRKTVETEVPMPMVVSERTNRKMTKNKMVRPTKVSVSAIQKSIANTSMNVVQETVRFGFFMNNLAVSA